MALDQDVKASIVAKYAKKDGDTGSAQVQIAIINRANQSINWALKNQ